MADLSNPTSQKRTKLRADARQSLQHGSRNIRHKRKDLGRKEWSRQKLDRRAENDDRNTKRRKVNADDADAPGAGPTFSQEEISAESRRPKHKVAVMIGYSGTGYKGMQINTVEKTIEGDLFAAFVAAGAISKANADDPKKSALVRCARTDKGVHAAGNVISLKLIIEEADIISKINQNLSSQIRVWGIQRTVNSFSCYQACDSRWYEYLIPSHAFLPPHPSSYLGRQLVGIAEQANDRQEYSERQAEVASFWNTIEQNSIAPVLKSLDVSVRDLVARALYDSGVEDSSSSVQPSNVGQSEVLTQSNPNSATETVPPQQQASSQPLKLKTNADDQNSSGPIVESATNGLVDPAQHRPEGGQEISGISAKVINTDAVEAPQCVNESNFATFSPEATHFEVDGQSISNKQAVDAAVKTLRVTYMESKRSYRITKERLERIALALKAFLGTKNYHNYTIGKTFRDPSSNRHIKSFTLDPNPIVINGTEWLSLKIHGQSFMMHQIRKMVSMVALIVRCGCPISRIGETFGPDIVSIPKAPSLGLLLERPVFDSYNEGMATEFGREKIDFAKYETELQDFKQKEIYERIFREEEQTSAFQVFFNQIDAFKTPQFLYLTSAGLEAVKNISTARKDERLPPETITTFDSDEEATSDEIG